MATAADPICPLCGAAARALMRVAHTRIWRCAAAGCALEFCHPQMDDAALRGAYRDCYYPHDSSAPHFQGTEEYLLRQWFGAAQQRGFRFAQTALLDYGCGSGALLRVAAEFGARAVGIEPDDVAREKLAATGPRVHRDLRDLAGGGDAAHEQFDWITLWDVVEHLRRPWDDLRQLRSLLTPDGRLVISTPNAGSLKSRLLGARWDQRQNLTHFFYFNARSLAATLRAAGFERVEQLAAQLRYQHHGPARAWAQPALQRCGLQGELMFAASASATASAVVAAVPGPSQHSSQHSTQPPSQTPPLARQG